MLPAAMFDNQRTRVRSPPPPANGMYAPVPQMLLGPRNGEIVDKAGEFIESLSSHSRCFPIFKSEFMRRSGELNTAGEDLLESHYPHITTDDLSSEAKRGNEWRVTVDVTSHYHVRKEISNSVGQALVFLIGIKVPHALIVIRTPDGKNYSCGFGFHGAITPGETPIISKVHSLASKLFSKKTSHKVEPLRGAVYTADYMTPDRTREAKIIWVGILSHEILGRLNATLSTSFGPGRVLTLEGEYKDISTTFKCANCGIKTVAPYSKPFCMDPDCKNPKPIKERSAKNIISILEMVLTVDSIYLEASAFVRGNFYNCIEWAKHILGIPYLNCGIKGNPNDCLNVTEDEIGNIITAYEQNHAGLPNIIQSVQDRLSKKGVMRRIKDCVCCSGGKRRRKINKKYTKRLRLHSRRRRSIKKIK
jgi:hypothetical protein